VIEKFKKIKKHVFEVGEEADFESLALEIFDIQYNNVDVYKQYCNLIHRTPDTVKTLYDIPFMPVDFFRTHRISITKEPASLVFCSSGTTGSSTSHHEVPDPAIYDESLLKGFEKFYGKVDDYCILALLPSYLEREGSSLIYMAEKLIKLSRHHESGFYLYDYERLAKTLKSLKDNGTKTILIGVTYALLDLAADYPIDFPDLIIMETGGMKGKRKEMVREEVHKILTDAFHCPSIHSEYGMTELLSQAYSSGKGIYNPVPWMKILIRETEDPLSLAKCGITGGINVIDLANLYSCSFVAVQDLGRLHDDGSFEVLGRFDNSLIRGCNLLVYN